MNNKTIITVITLLAILIGLYFIYSKQSINIEESNQESSISRFKAISSHELAIMLENKDFKLIDVHIPEQDHIPNTDYFIPFNNMGKIVSVLPDENEKIVLYCRSGNMSKTVAKELIIRGYKNVFDLTNGIKEWMAEERKTILKESIKEI